MLNSKVCWTPQILAKKPIEGTQAEENNCNIKLGFMQSARLSLSTTSDGIHMRCD